MSNGALNDYRDSRIVRVFVSSTFRDLDDEREELVKVVFPRIEKLCAERDVTFVGIDLRSGVPEKLIAEGDLLPICLAEVDRCRPFFIGLLAERYGSIPEISPALLERYPWVKPLLGRSITELEIRYGALASKNRFSHACFYFRDSGSVPKVAAATQQHAPQIDADVRLTRLKDEVRNSGLRVRGYRNRAELGELVFMDFQELIDRDFPPEETDNRTSENRKHQTFIDSRLRVYAGREEADRRFEQEVNRHQGLLFVSGVAGQGKSALLANWVTRQRRTNPQGLIVAHFVEASHFSANVPAMMRRILTELMFLCELSDEIPEQPAALDLQRWLQKAATKQPLTLVIDGIDHLDIPDNRSRYYWLPHEIPDGVRVVFCSSAEPELHWLVRRGVRLFPLVPLTLEQVEQICTSYLAFFGKRLDADLKERIVLTRASSNPLFLITLLEEVRLTGSETGLKDRIIRLLVAPDLATLFNLVMARYENDFERHRPHLVRDTMRLLWAARRGLTEQELRDFLGAEGSRLPQVLWSPLFLACEKAFVYRDGRVAFASDSHREAVRRRYLDSPEKEARARASLVHYAYYRGSYGTKLRELPWQLYQLGDAPNLVTVLTDPQFFESLWRDNKWDVLRYWATLERETDASAVKAYELALAQPDKFGTLTAIWYLSCLLDELGHTVAAVNLRKWMVDHYQQAGDEANVIATLGNTGILLARQGRFEEALAVFREQEQAGRRLGQLRQVQLALANIANALVLSGDASGACQAYERHKALCDELNDRASLTFYYNGIGQLQLSNGELENAFESFRKCTEISHEIGDMSMGQASIGNQGNVLMAMGRFEEALQFFLLQESICREINHKEGLVGALGNRGMLLRQQGQAEAALPLHIEETEVARQIGFAYGLRQGLAHHAEALLTLDRLEEALELYRECVAHCQSNKDAAGLKLARNQVGAILERQGNARSQQGNFEGACDSYRSMIQEGKENQDGLLVDAGQQHLLNILHIECTKRLNDDDYLGAMRLLQEMEELFADRNDAANQTGVLKTELAVNQKQAENEYDSANLKGKIALLQERGRILRSLAWVEDVKANLGFQWTLFSHLLWEQFDAGELDAALGSAKKAQSIGTELDDRDRIEKSLSNILMILGQKAELELDQKRYSAALELYLEAEQAAQVLGTEDELNAARHNQKLVRRKMSESSSRE